MPREGLETLLPAWGGRHTSKWRCYISGGGSRAQCPHAPMLQSSGLKAPFCAAQGNDSLQDLVYEVWEQGRSENAARVAVSKTAFRI